MRTGRCASSRDRFPACSAAPSRPAPPRPDLQPRGAGARRPAGAGGCAVENAGLLTGLLAGVLSPSRDRVERSSVVVAVCAGLVLVVAGVHSLAIPVVLALIHRAGTRVPSGRRRRMT